MAVGDMDDCGHHNNQKVVLFCQTCHELICTKCISKTGNSSARHQDHVYLDLMDAYDMLQEDMQKIVAKLKESVDTKRQQRQETLVRIQKLKFALLRKKGFVSKECVSLHSLIKCEEHLFNSRLERVIGTALECEERAHKELDYDTVSREGLIGTVDSVSKISPFRCNMYIKNITRVKKEILEALMRDEECMVQGSGDLWMAQIHRLRDVTLSVHGEKAALVRAFHFPTDVPSAPRILFSWCVVGAAKATVVWKYKRHERVDRFKVTFTPINLRKSCHLREKKTISIKPILAKRNHAVLRDLSANCEYSIQIRGVNCAGEGLPAEANFYTHISSDSMFQGHVWSDHNPAVPVQYCKSIFRYLRQLAMIIIALFALFWVIASTYEVEFCSALREVPVSKTPAQHLDNMCPMPEQMRISMLTKAVDKPSDSLAKTNYWLDWFSTKDHEAESWLDWFTS